MDWDKLRIFQAVADAGSFTHAGEGLKLSQSAISRQIGALEEVLHRVRRRRLPDAEPAAEQRDLVVPEHELRAPGLGELAHEGERAVALGPAVHEIADAPELEAGAELAPRAREDVLELVRAPLHVAHEDALHASEL